jgi:hypothetical protein
VAAYRPGWPAHFNYEKKPSVEENIMPEPKLKMETLSISVPENKIVDACSNYWLFPLDVPEGDVDKQLSETEVHFIDFMKYVSGLMQTNPELIIEFVKDCINEQFAEIAYGIEKSLEDILLNHVLDEAITIDTKTIQATLHTNIVDQSRDITELVAFTRLMLAIYLYCYIKRALGVDIELVQKEDGKYITFNLTSKAPEIDRIFKNLLQSSFAKVE